MEQQHNIQREVDALKGEISDTRALYREVCALLFFRYGITPTANKLYQYVRKGTMSVPAEVLMGFWKELRERARVEIDHPGLPPALRRSAGQLVATLWEQAAQAAREELASLRVDAQAEARSASTRLQAAEQEKADLQKELKTAALLRERVVEENQALTAALEEERREHAATLARQQTLVQQLTELREEFQKARQHFSDELEKGREAVRHAARRAEEAERRALLDMDQERSARTALARQLDTSKNQLAQVRQALQAQELQSTARQARLESELAAARQAAADAVQAQQQQHLQWQEAMQLATRHQAEATALRNLAQQTRPITPRPLRRNRRPPEQGGKP